jgi:hypothetical protein
MKDKVMSDKIYFLKPNIEETNLEIPRLDLTVSCFTPVDLKCVVDDSGEEYLKVKKKFLKVISVEDNEDIYNLNYRSFIIFKTVKEYNDKIDIYYKYSSNSYSLLVDIESEEEGVFAKYMVEVPKNILDRYLETW